MNFHNATSPAGGTQSANLRLAPLSEVLDGLLQL